MIQRGGQPARRATASKGDQAARLHRTSGDLIDQPERRVLRLAQDRADPFGVKLVAHAALERPPKRVNTSSSKKLAKSVATFGRLTQTGRRSCRPPADAETDIHRGLLPLVKQRRIGTICPSVIEIRLVGI